MKITANLEFDTFAEAEKMFRHLGMLEGANAFDAAHSDGVKSEQAEKPKTNGAHPTPAAPPVADTPTSSPTSTAAFPSDDVISDEVLIESVNAAIKAGRLRALHINQIYEALAGGVKRHRDVPRECRQKVKLALDTGTQERPLGEAA